MCNDMGGHWNQAIWPQAKFHFRSDFWALEATVSGFCSGQPWHRAQAGTETY